MAEPDESSSAPPTPSLPSELPVVPLRETVVLPLTVAPLGVGRAISIEAINRALAGDRMVLLLLQRGEADEGGQAGARPVCRFGEGRCGAGDFRGRQGG